VTALCPISAAVLSNYLRTAWSLSLSLFSIRYGSSGATGYGLATFNLSHHTGVEGPKGIAYGHLGATYGYQSIVAYFPALDFSLAIGTNTETDYQSQPSDAMCRFVAVH